MRKYARLLLGVLLVSVLGIYPLLAPTAHRINEAHFKLIQVGMTRAASLATIKKCAEAMILR